MTVSNTEVLDLSISGMTCASCSTRLERVLNQTPGVVRAQVNLATEKARIVTADGGPDLPALVEVVKRTGFEAAPVASSAELRAAEEARAAMRMRGEERLLAISVLLTLPLVLPMVLAPFGIDLSLPPLVQLAIASLVQFGVGSRFYSGAWKSLRGGTGNMDVLVALGTSAAYGLSAWTAVKGGHGHALYFEGGATVITLVLLGKVLEAKAKRGTSEAIRALGRLRPETATVERNGELLSIPAAALFVGDVMLIRPGELIPADGEVIGGNSHVDESLLTGESMPVEKNPGDALTGGAVNGDGMLRAVVTAAGADSKLSRMIEMVDGALASKAPVQKLVDRISAVFVPVVAAVALAAFLWWWRADGLEQAMTVAASVLVVACPCALGLATPAALIVGVGAAARDGILIKDAEALEVAHTINVAVFDKTGTLTEGRPAVTDIHSADGDGVALLRLTAAAQQGSEHPLARAVREKAAAEGISALPRLDDFTAVPGKGLLAVIEGRSFYIGSRRLLVEQGGDSSPLAGKADELEAAGRTLIWIGENGRGLIGLMGLSDPVKPSARQAVEKLRRLGVESVLLTGDNRRAAQAVAAELGISKVLAEVLPGDKAGEIIRLKAEGRKVAMIGDGVNDAPALAAADIGIAMGTGTDVAMHTAGITLMRGDPALAADAIIASRATHRKIRLNLFWAFVYNVVAIPLAVLGMLTPMAAGAAMAMSSVSVVTSSIRLREDYRKRKERGY